MERRARKRARRATEPPKPFLVCGIFSGRLLGGPPRRRMEPGISRGDRASSGRTPARSRGSAPESRREDARAHRGYAERGSGAPAYGGTPRRPPASRGCALCDALRRAGDDNAFVPRLEVTSSARELLGHDLVVV